MENLPEELLREEIVSYLDPQSFENLSLTSKDLHRQVESERERYRKRYLMKEESITLNPFEIVEHPLYNRLILPEVDVPSTWNLSLQGNVIRKEDVYIPEGKIRLEGVSTLIPSRFTITCFFVKNRLEGDYWFEYEYDNDGDMLRRIIYITFENGEKKSLYCIDNTYEETFTYISFINNLPVLQKDYDFEDDITKENLLDLISNKNNYLLNLTFRYQYGFTYKIEKGVHSVLRRRNKEEYLTWNLNNGSYQYYEKENKVDYSVRQTRFLARSFFSFVRLVEYSYKKPNKNVFNVGTGPAAIGGRIQKGIDIFAPSYVNIEYQPNLFHIIMEYPGHVEISYYSNGTIHYIIMDEEYLFDPEGYQISGPII